MKRNDIVVERDPGLMFALYGRINRILPNDKVEVIYVTGFVRISQKQDLCLIKGYEGLILNGRLCRMPSLRKIKQRISRYSNTIWKRNREGSGFYEYTDFSMENNHD